MENVLNARQCMSGDIVGEAHEKLDRVFYQVKAYSEPNTKVMAGMLHLGRLPAGAELLLHIDDDDKLCTHWQFARALRQRYLPNMIFT